MKSLAASFPDVKNPDLWFPAVSMIVIATAASLLLLDFYKEYDYQRDKKEKIGKIIYKSKTSQRRQNARVIWSNVEKETPIYNFDTIRTEDLSEAVIELNDGTRIALEENTMVVVSFSRKETNINFTKGTVRALQKYNDSEINIKAGNKEIKATEVGNLVLSSKNGRDFTAVSKKGKLTITDDAGLPKSISNEEELRFSNQSTEVEKLSLNLISPEDNVRYYTAGSPVKVTLKYKNDENHPLLLQLSDHYSFSKVIKELKTRSGNTSVSLTEGNYYWRILNKETDKKSEIRSVKIIKNKPVTLYTPESNRNFSYTYLSPSINFSWSRNDIASNYILQVSKDKNFKKPLILNEEISAMRISYNLDEGKYYWRVIASGISEESKISSREQTFNVTKIPRQHPPVLLFPLPESVIQRYEVREHGLTFNWESKKELNAIELIISESSDFKKHYTLQNTDRNYILYKADMKPGYYYWKIRGKDSRGNYTDFSKILRFRVIESDEITLLYPAGGKIYTWQESMSNGILLGWKPIGFKADYKLVISKQKSFNKIDLNKKITSSRFKIRNLKAGTYFWKVSLVDISGDDIIASRISKFQLLENIENPVIVYPPDGRNIDLSGKQSIEFQWIKSKDADYYILELYELKTDKKIFAEKTKKNSFEFKALQSLNQGRYNWRITAVKKSDGEESPGETVEGNFIIQLKTIKPPQFITE